MATVFEPISPVPPMTTIFMVYPPLSKPEAQRLVQFAKRCQGPMVGRSEGIRTLAGRAPVPALPLGHYAPRKEALNLTLT
jgi:hypothetical protein